MYFYQIVILMTVFMLNSTYFIPETTLDVVIRLQYVRYEWFFRFKKCTFFKTKWLKNALKFLHSCLIEREDSPKCVQDMPPKCPFISSFVIKVTLMIGFLNGLASLGLTK